MFPVMDGTGKSDEEMLRWVAGQWLHSRVDVAEKAIRVTLRRKAGSDSRFFVFYTASSL
jgi:hypothetical protein